MRRTSLTSRLAAVAAVAALATGAAAAAPADAPGFTDEETGLFFAEQEGFFVPGASGIANLDHPSGDIVTWDAAVGGSTAYAVMNNYSTFAGDRYGNTFTAEGTFTGNLDTIAVEFIVQSLAAGVCDLDALAWDLRIDGETILFTEQSSPSAGLRTMPNGDDTATIMFAFTGIHEQMDRRDLVGDDTTEHTVFMNFANFYACQEAIAHFGSADAPARLIANVQPQGRRDRWVNYTEVPVSNPPPPLA